MWTLVKPELPEELKAVTTSVWDYNGTVTVGVMRQFFTRPPVLWAQPGTFTTGDVKRARKSLDELQEIIFSPLVYAETFVEEPRNHRFLLYLGFREIAGSPQRKFYERSL